METTKIVNVFNQTERKIICIANEHDYLGDESLIKEDDLEVGKIYTFISGEAQPYGMMVHLVEVENKHKYGYQSYLFEEVEEYDKDILKVAYEDWLNKELDKGLQSIKEGKCISHKKAMKMLKRGIKKKMKEIKKEEKECSKVKRTEM